MALSKENLHAQIFCNVQMTGQYSYKISIQLQLHIYTVSPKNWATFIFTVTLANFGRFFKFFQCRNNKNEKFPTAA